jgi:hypothetical protein
MIQSHHPLFRLKTKGLSTLDSQKEHVNKLMDVQDAHSNYGMNRQKCQPGDYVDYLDVVKATTEGPLPTVIKTKLKLLKQSNR